MRDNGYIAAISAASDRYGDKLLQLMEFYGVSCLMDVTEEQAMEFYNRFIEKE